MHDVEKEKCQPATHDTLTCLDALVGTPVECSTDHCHSIQTSQDPVRPLIISIHVSCV